MRCVDLLKDWGQDKIGSYSKRIGITQAMMQITINLNKDVHWREGI